MIWTIVQSMFLTLLPLNELVLNCDYLWWASLDGCHVAHRSPVVAHVAQWNDSHAERGDACRTERWPLRAGCAFQRAGHRGITLGGPLSLIALTVIDQAFTLCPIDAINGRIQPCLHVRLCLRCYLIFLFRDGDFHRTAISVWFDLIPFHVSTQHGSRTVSTLFAFFVFF